VPVIDYRRTDHSRIGVRLEEFCHAGEIVFPERSGIIVETRKKRLSRGTDKKVSASTGSPAPRRLQDLHFRSECSRKERLRNVVSSVYVDDYLGRAWRTAKDIVYSPGELFGASPGWNKN
jgi:hypothetical protein